MCIIDEIWDMPWDIPDLLFPAPSELVQNWILAKNSMTLPESAACE